MDELKNPAPIDQTDTETPVVDQQPISIPSQAAPFTVNQLSVEEPEGQTEVDSRTACAQNREHNIQTMAMAEYTVSRMQLSASIDDQAIINQTLRGVEEGIEEPEKSPTLAYQGYSLNLKDEISVEDLMTEYNVASLTLLEVLSLRKKMYHDLVDLRSCQQLITSLGQLIPDGMTDIDNGTKIAAANYMDRFGFKDFDLESFTAFYNKYGPVLAEFVLALDDKLQELREGRITSKSLSENLIDIMQRKLKGLNENDPNYQLKASRCQTIINAYTLRLQDPMQVFGVLTDAILAITLNKRTYKKMFKAIAAGPASISKLTATYDKATLATFISNARRHIIDDSGKDIAISFLLYVLNRMISKGLTQKVWVDIIISDVIDVASGTYDIRQPEWWIEGFQIATNVTNTELNHVATLDNLRTDIDVTKLAQYVNEMDERYRDASSAKDSDEPEPEPTDDEVYPDGRPEEDVEIEVAADASEESQDGSAAEDQ